MTSKSEIGGECDLHRTADEIVTNLESLVKEACRLLATRSLSDVSYLTTKRTAYGFNFELPKKASKKDYQSAASQIAANELAKLPATSAIEQLVLDSTSATANMKAFLPVPGLSLGDIPLQAEVQQRIISPFLHKYFSVNSSPTFDPERFKLIAAAFVSALVKGEARRVELAILLNVRLSASDVVFSDVVRLRKVRSDEIERLINSPIGFSQERLPIRPHLVDCAVETLYVQVGAQQASSGEPESVSDVLSLLQLYGGQPVRLAYTFDYALDGDYGGERVGWDPSPGFYDGSVTVDADMSKVLVGGWRRLQSEPSESLLRLSLRRLGETFSRTHHLDILLDCWIALEALFVRDDKELAHKAALRIATFLASGPRRVEIFRDIKKSYGLRSWAVHGMHGKQKASQGLDVVAESTRTYLRLALIRLLETDKTLIPDELDLALLAGQSVD